MTNSSIYSPINRKWHLLQILYIALSFNQLVYVSPHISLKRDMKRVKYQKKLIIY